MNFHAPVVDISSWVSGGVDRERTRSAVAVDEALVQFSVVQIVGHDIPESVFRGLGSAMDKLFGLEPDAKRALEAPHGVNRGFTASGSEGLSRSLGIPAEPLDSFEAFTIGAEDADYPHARTRGVVYAPSIWPDIPEFRRHIDTYFNEAGRVTRTLMSVLGEGLGVGRTYFNLLTDHSVDTMRLNHYPAEQPTGAGMSAHTDYGFTTLVCAERVPGLQIAHEGRWHDVVPAPNALFVFVGDLLSRSTNEHWLPTLHRVQHTAGVDRRSIMFYHDGNAEAEVAAIPGLVPPGTQALHPPVVVGDHITEKVSASRYGRDYAGSARVRARLPLG